MNHKAFTTKVKPIHSLRKSTVRSLETIANLKIRLRECDKLVRDLSVSEEIFSNIDHSEDGHKRHQEDLSTTNINLTPGGGEKTIVIFTDADGNQILAWLDSGSTTTLVSRNYLKKMNFKPYKLDKIVDFNGLYGTKRENHPECYLINLLSKKFMDLTFPAYVTDALPSGADILIGTDQLGKSIKMTLGFDRDLMVSVRDRSKNVVDYVIKGRMDGQPEIIASSEKRGRDADSKATREESCLNNENNILPRTESMEKTEDMDVMSSHCIEGITSVPNTYENQHVSSFEPIFLFNGDEEPYEMKVLVQRARLMSSLKETQELINAHIETPNLNTRKSRKQFREYKIDCTRQLKENENIIIKRIKELDESYHKHELTRKANIQKERLRLKANNHLVTDDSRWEGIGKQNCLTKKQRSEATLKLEEEIKRLAEEDSLKYFTKEYGEREDSSTTTETNTFRNNEVVNLMAAVAETIADQPLGMEWDYAWDAGGEKDVCFVPHVLQVNEQELADALLRSKQNTLVGKDENIPMGKATLPDGTRLEFDIVISEEGKITLTSKNTNKPYKMKKPLLEVLKRTLIDMELQGVGEMNANWSAEFASPAFFVTKGGKNRFCVNFTELNKVTVNDIYPVPDIDNILEDLNGKEYFSIIDLKSGYHQFPLSNNAKKYAACITPEGIFKYNCMTFGFKNAPAFFQRFMNIAFKDHIGIFVRIYVDDIVIYSDNFLDHLKHIEIILNILEKCNIKANRDKCHFFLKEMRVLGKIISKEGIKPDPELISAMVDFPVPNSKTRVRSFLALCSHYRHFVKDFYKFAAVLNPLTRNDITWNKDTWSEVHQHAFLALKHEMTVVGDKTVLAYPDWNSPFHIQSDACLLGAGAVLTQLNQDGKRRVIAYASWNFSDTQRNYSTTERELLGFLFAVRKWRSFLWGRRFTADTDHQPLTGTLRLEDPHGRIARWSAELAQYDFKLGYLPGKDNVPSDTLSRIYDETISQLSDFKLIEEDNTIRSEYILKLETDKLSMENPRNSKNLVESFEKHWGEEEILLEDIIEENTLGFIDYRLPSNEEWAKAQLEDPSFKDIYVYLRDKTLPNDDTRRSVLNDAQYFEIDKTTNLLMRNTKLRPSDPLTTLRICLPKKYFTIMTTLYHDSIWAGGHQGVEKTLDKITEKYFHKSIRAFVKTWTRTCDICHRIKRAHPIGSLNNHALGSLTTNIKPWDLVCIDVWSPGVTSDMNNTEVLTVIDVGSRFAFALPLVNAKAKTIALALFTHVFNHMPLPKRIHSDRGKNLIGEVMTQLKELFQLDTSKTTAYHPEGNSVAERIHQFFRNSLTAYISDDQKDWDVFLPALMRIYLDANHNGLGGHYSPSEIVFGRKLGYIDEDKLYNKVEGERIVVERLRLGLARASQCILKELEVRRAKKIAIKEKRDQLLIDNKLHRWVKKTRKEPFKVGDRVGLRVEKVDEAYESKKLFHRFTGPYTIASTALDGKVLYLHNPYTGRDEPSPVPANRVIDFPSRNVSPEEINGDDLYQKVTIDDFSGDDGSDSEEEAEEMDTELNDQSATSIPDLPVRQLPRYSTHSLRIAMQNVVNQRIRVWWPKEKQWFSGLVVALSKKNNITEGNKKDTGTHDIIYDDDRKKRMYEPISEVLFGDQAEIWEYI